MADYLHTVVSFSLFLSTPISTFHFSDRLIAVIKRSIINVSNFFSGISPVIKLIKKLGVGGYAPMVSLSRMEQ